MVVKPLEFVVRGSRGLVQPAVKCRGTEYLRIIYGPEYSLPQNLDRLRSRGLGVKRSLALAGVRSRRRRRWSGSCDASHSVASTSAFLACLRWRASLSIPVSRPSLVAHRTSF